MKNFWLSLLLIPALASAQTSPQLQAQLNTELNKCRSEKSLAEKCCGDPMSCSNAMSPQAKQQLMQLVAMGAMAAMSMTKSGGSGISAEGIAGLCSMLSALGSAGGGVNSGAAQVCEETRGKCSAACARVAEQWTARKTTCNGTCPDAAFLENAVSQFTTEQSTCDGLQANTSSMQQQGRQQSGAGGAGEFCSQIAGMMQQNQDQMQAASVIDCNDPANYENPVCIDCKADPENKQCGGALADQKSNLGFSNSSAVSAADFNTGQGIDGLSQNPQFGNYEAKANQSGTVSGGGGGGIMGGGNNGGGFSTEPMGNQEEGGGYNTDVLQGERGGGGYSAGGMGVDAAGGFSGYGGGGGGGEEAMPYEGMDLKKFLPGGAMDPSRRVASALVTAGQINGKSEDIFQRVTLRIKAVCSTKRLKDCQGK